MLEPNVALPKSLIFHESSPWSSPNFSSHHERMSAPSRFAPIYCILPCIHRQMEHFFLAFPISLSFQSPFAIFSKTIILIFTCKNWEKKNISDLPSVWSRTSFLFQFFHDGFAAFEPFAWFWIGKSPLFHMNYSMQPTCKRSFEINRKIIKKYEYRFSFGWI